MGRDSNYSPPKKHHASCMCPDCEREKTMRELEAKLTLTGPFELSEVVWPKLFNMQWIEKEPVVSKHAFYYDDKDQYQFSMTDKRKIKQKTDAETLYFDGIPILQRLEMVTQMEHPTTGLRSFLKFFNTFHEKDPQTIRTLHRRRQSLALHKEGTKFFVAYDYCYVGDFGASEPNHQVLHQLEIETVFPANIYGKLDWKAEQIANLVKHLLFQGVKFELGGETKYDWIKRIHPECM